MTKEIFSTDEKVLKKHPPEHDAPTHDIPERQDTPQSGITLLQQQVGNRAVQRLLAQRSGGAADSSQPFEVEEKTAQRIEQERGGGQALDSAMQKQMGAAMGFDFSQVKVHASPEADALNRDLGAEAFTTGNDIYFREGTYDPHSSGGQELLAHEMTHVVQQSNGLVGGGTRMTVNAPDDAYENKADAVAQAAVSGRDGGRDGSPGAIQTEEVQRQEVPEEEELQMQELEEEEEQIQMQREEEDEYKTDLASASSQETAQAPAESTLTGGMPTTEQAPASTTPGPAEEQFPTAEQQQTPGAPSEQSGRSRLEEEETLQMKKKR